MSEIVTTRFRKLLPSEGWETGMEEKGSMMNRTIKAAVGMIAIAAMSVGTLAACGGSSSSSDSKGKVYYLNFKPESSDEWKKLAKDYTKETGVEVKVQTAASGTYEQTLKSEIAKSEAPTLFQVNGPVGYQNWKSYTDDMTDTEPYKQLINKDVALKDGSKVVGVPYAMETYGLIYNKDLLAKYIATDGAKIKDVKDIDNFDTLKAVADDIQAKKDQLGVKGSFHTRQTDVDVQAAVRGGGVVGLRDRLPLDSVCFKYLLNFVIVSDVPEPTVKFCKENHVEVVSTDTIKKPDKFLPASEFLPGSQGLVDESVNQHHAIHFDELIEESVLRFQSVTVKDLTVMGTTYIFNNTQAEEFRLRSEVCTIHKNLLSAVKKA